MRFAFKIIIALFLFAPFIVAQDSRREQNLQKIDELNSQIKDLETEVLLPDAKDLKAARKENFNVFRLMPREKFDRKFTVQGGGSYFSFTTGSQDYQKIAQIGLEQNNLKVGFAGADYGFINDLGEMALADVTKDTPQVNFLLNYKPPTEEPEIRHEQRKAWNYEANGAVYKSNLPAVVGHSYVLRAISFNNADALVALKVYRKDTDGSLIIFWKNIANFQTPQIERNQVVVDSSQISEPKAETTDYEAANAVQTALSQAGLFGVSIEAVGKSVTLRGTVPKGKMAEAVRIATEAGKKPIRNELIESVCNYFRQFAARSTGSRRCESSLRLSAVILRNSSTTRGTD